MILAGFHCVSHSNGDFRGLEFGLVGWFVHRLVQFSEGLNDPFDVKMVVDHVKRIQGWLDVVRH